MCPHNCAHNFTADIDRSAVWQRESVGDRRVLAMKTTLGVLLSVLLLAGCGGGGDGDSGGPAYDVVDDDPDGGNQKSIIVEVDSTDDLEAVYDAVRDEYDEDGGYLVYLNCSSGGTAVSDNRLSNGKYAVGNIGAATTGLEDGGSTFELLDGATCP